MIYYASNNPNGFVTGKRFSIDKPAVTIMAAGMGGDSLGHWHLEEDNLPDYIPPPEPGKPPYRVPLMAEIAALPWNGLKVASTFSGAGGSCTGYRMAGYKVVWANEFVPAAQESYKANAAPDCILDPRDIKVVTAAEILEATGLAPGELDLFDGSPPCQAFSTAGKREKGWGKDKSYEHGAKQKNEDLFFEYARLLEGLQPRVFIAENVSGLVKGTAKGYFLDILKQLKACGYNVEARLLDAQWLGVPQQRQRIIFCGVRNDLDLAPAFPKPLTYRYSVREAIPYAIRHSTHPGGTWEVGWEASDRVPTQTLLASGPNPTGQVEVGEDYEIIVANKAPTKQSGYLRYVEPETDISKYAIGDEWDRLEEGEQSDKYFSLVKVDGEKPSPTIQATHGGSSIAQPLHPTIKRKFTIAEVKRLCSFPDDFVLRGTYGQQWERLGNSVPPVMMSHIAATIRDEVLLR